MDIPTLNALRNDFGSKHLLLVGDVMIDAYVWGSVNRMSPEAPVPVLDVAKKEERLGGLANVAINLKQLGAKVTICSVIGNDEAGNRLLRLFEEHNIDTRFIIRSLNRVTTVKTRVISNNKHVMRIDEEQTDDIDALDESQLQDTVSGILESGETDAILFEDYNKGVLTLNTISGIIRAAQAKNIPTCVDPKKKNFFAYRGVTLFKPNLKELSEGLDQAILQTDLSQLQHADALLREKLGHKYSLLTLSEHGVFFSGAEGGRQLAAHPRTIADVSGAGDTVIAVAALCIACGCSIADTAFLSNLAGGIVCEYVGVVPVSKNKLFDEATKALA